MTLAPVIQTLALRPGWLARDIARAQASRLAWEQTLQRMAAAEYEPADRRAPS